MSATVINLADYRKGRVAQPAPPTSQRNDKKAIIQTLLNDIAANLGVDLSAPAPSKGKPKR